MKNILEILKQFGITIPEDKLASFETMVAENYKTIADYNNQKAKLDASEDKVKTLTESLDKFKDVDPAALNQTINKAISINFFIFTISLVLVALEKLNIINMIIYI